jgi:serine/threonine protein kinase
MGSWSRRWTVRSGKTVPGPISLEGIVHRDLNPGNVFLDVGKPMECYERPGSAIVPKSSDFGLVAAIDMDHAPELVSLMLANGGDPC